MKLRNIFPVVLCILIGFFMGNFMFNQYGIEDTTAVVSSNGETLKFLQAGVYSSKESMEESMKNFNYYILILYISSQVNAIVHFGLQR